MADKLVLPLGLAVLGAGVWWLWSNQGIPESMYDTQAFSPVSFDPYAFWKCHRKAGFIRHYPDRVAPNCLNVALSEEDSTLSTRQGATPYG